MATAPVTTGTISEASKDQIKAVIYGQCIGDAIGLLTEFLTKAEAKKYYGTVKKELEFIHKSIVSDMHRVRWKEGDWTDDSDQMILILQSIIDSDGKVNYTDFAAKLKHWMHHGFSELGDFAGLGQGKTTSTVVNNPKYLDDPHAAAELVWTANQCKIAPNGGVMRTSIVGVHCFWDLPQVVENSLSLVKTTHFDHRCRASAVAVSTAIAIMLQRDAKYLDGKGKYKVNLIIEEAYSHAVKCIVIEDQKQELLKYMKCTNIKELKLDEPGKIGYTFKSLGCGFWGLKQTDFRKAITKITMQGGDADSNACVAGALLGCKLGLDAIPLSWKDKLLHKDWLDQIIQRYFTVMKWNDSAAT